MPVASTVTSTTPRARKSKTQPAINAWVKEDFLSTRTYRNRLLAAKVVGMANGRYMWCTWNQVAKSDCTASGFEDSETLARDAADKALAG